MICVKSVSKQFTEGGAFVKVLNDVSFECPGGKITAIVGSTGAGKSTMLSILAGLEKADAGDVNIAIGGTKDVGYMMQDPLLLPWRTLRENALLGAEIKGIDNCESECARYFNAFGLDGSESLYPDAASGGMKQRVALIRTLLTRPTIILMDEPFSSLDFDTKLRVQRHLMEYHNKQRSTIAIVTHDIEDAIALSDRIIILTGKPATVKRQLDMEPATPLHDPVAARKSPQFVEFFALIWDELKIFEDTPREEGRE